MPGSGIKAGEDDLFMYNKILSVIAAVEIFIFDHFKMGNGIRYAEIDAITGSGQYHLQVVLQLFADKNGAFVNLNSY